MNNRNPFDQMWAEALALLNRADHMHRQFFQLRPAAAHPVWEPPVDVLEDDDGIHIIVALPGVAPENVSVTSEASELIVRAVRAWPGHATDATIRRIEIPHGHFERRIALPRARLALTHSRLANGCLYLTLNTSGA